MDELTICEISGHWNATDEELTNMLEASFEAFDWDLFSMTEVSTHRFRATLQSFCKKHELHLHHPSSRGANECCWISKKPFSKKWSRQVTSLRLPFGRTAPTYIVSARIKGWGRFDKLHTPAHTGGLRYNNQFTRTYRSVLQWFSSHVPRKLRRKRWISADWNLHLKLAKNRTTINKAIGNELQWAGSMDQDNTIGNRVIDGAFTNMKVIKRTMTILRKWRGFDHKMTLTVIGR